MNDISLRVSELKKTLRRQLALDGVTAYFEAGLLHGVIGSDGAGKTTLLRTLIGLLFPQEGTFEYQIGGTSRPFAEVRPHIAYMPQTQSLYPDLSCSEHLDFFRDMYRLPHDVYLRRREELLHITRLDKFQDRPAAQLSGGMYKKLGLMCALLASPRVLLLDEPTNGVDPISRREFWDLLYRLKGNQILILISTAYMDEAERCDRVHLMDRGRMLLEGEPRQILEQERVRNFEEYFLHHASLQEETL